MTSRGNENGYPDFSVLGVDPGKATGIFVFQWWASGRSAVHRDEWDWQMFCQRMPHMLEHPKRPHLVAVERFTITQRTAKVSAQSDPLDVIGALKFLCYVNGVELVVRSKSNTTHHGSDAQLSAAGWRHPGLRHANDAARHALHAVAVRRPDIYQKLTM